VAVCTLSVLALELHQAGGAGLQEICMLGQWEHIEKDLAEVQWMAEIERAKKAAVATVARPVWTSGAAVFQKSETTHGWSRKLQFISCLINECYQNKTKFTKLTIICIELDLTLRRSAAQIPTDCSMPQEWDVKMVPYFSGAV